MEDWVNWVDELKMKESIELTNSHLYKSFLQTHTALESQIAKLGQTNPVKCNQLKQSRDYNKLFYESTKTMTEIHHQIFNNHKEFAKEKNEFKLKNLSTSKDDSFFERLRQWEIQFTKSHLTPLYEQRRTLTPVLDFFWEKAIYSQKLVKDRITDKDADIISFLIDIESEWLPDGIGFELKFTFKDNDYFKNKYLTKKYEVSPYIVEKYAAESSLRGLKDKKVVKLHVVGTKIDWISCPFSDRQRKKSFFCTFFDSDFTTGLIMFDTKDGELKGNIPTDYLIGKKFQDNIIPLATYSFVYLKIPDCDQNDNDSDRDYVCECDDGFVTCALCRKDRRESESDSDDE